LDELASYLAAEASALAAPDLDPEVALVAQLRHNIGP
jgi:hypothetical protein